ncbi:uncharacterized protein BJ171DRAFT_234060 [Polychytrium aggregatum]|uniref:uncharacterized protein n=1 Tax=Polychytrium aggregatum TaxID=110093 RepID=UPI0022FE5DAB|nr:uncharacterized protein BJ171DRAFT_234060 [Polychytrium aggregatum]KAI9208079.1 hypothetical protein BJ171DRAFT_234060 [Polychytrium aggregatum]
MALACEMTAAGQCCQRQHLHLHLHLHLDGEPVAHRRAAIAFGHHHIRAPSPVGIPQSHRRRRVVLSEPGGLRARSDGMTQAWSSSWWPDATSITPGPIPPYKSAASGLIRSRYHQQHPHQRQRYPSQQYPPTSLSDHTACCTTSKPPKSHPRTDISPRTGPTPAACPRKEAPAAPITGAASRTTLTTLWTTQMPDRSPRTTCRLRLCSWSMRKPSAS